MIVDQDKFMGIINGSNWPSTRIIKKHELLQHLLLYEVCEKRRGAMLCIAKGLGHLGLTPLLNAHFPLFKEVLIHSGKKMTAKDLIDLMINCEDKEAGPLNMQSYNYFIKYLYDREAGEFWPLSSL